MRIRCWALVNQLHKTCLGLSMTQMQGHGLPHADSTRLRNKDADFNLCKGAILCADRVLTAPELHFSSRPFGSKLSSSAEVSPSYAAEVRTPEGGAWQMGSVCSTVKCPSLFLKGRHKRRTFLACRQHVQEASGWMT